MNDLISYFDRFIKYILILIFFSLGGLPPLIGFILKWYSIYLYLLDINVFIMFILIFYSLAYLYYYLHLIIIIILNNLLRIKIYYTVRVYSIKVYFILIIVLSIERLFLVIFLL